MLQKDGRFFFCFFVRHVLESAATTNEAVKLLRTIPHRDSYNYTVVDRDNRMAVVETRRDKISVRYPPHGEDCLVSTNHFEHPDMLKENINLLPNSIIRNKNTGSFLRKNKNKITTDLLDSWLDTSYENGGVYMSHYQPFFFGTLYSLTADLQTLEVKYRIGEKQPSQSIKIAELLKDSYITDDPSGLIREFSAKLHNRFPSLTDYADLDWWATPENRGIKVFSTLAGSVNPIGLILENRFAYRIPLENPTWGPYLDTGVLQNITPVFHRHGIYLRWSNKFWIDAELGYEYHVGFRGIEVKKENGKYEEIDINHRLENKDTTYFSTHLYRLALQIHESFGPLLIINYFDYFAWKQSKQIESFYNFETGISQGFSGDLRNNFMALLPIGAPEWTAGLFYQINWLADEEGYAQFAGIQVNFIKFKRSNDAIFRIGYHSHDKTQINAPGGLGIQVLIKRQWY